MGVGWKLGGGGGMKIDGVCLGIVGGGECWWRDKGGMGLGMVVGRYGVWEGWEEGL